MSASSPPSKLGYGPHANVAIVGDGTLDSAHADISPATDEGGGI
jgi:hypothetical protein